MTLSEAIIHCEEVAKEQDKLYKRYGDASRYIRSHNKDIVSANAKKALNVLNVQKNTDNSLNGSKNYSTAGQSGGGFHAVSGCRKMMREFWQRLHGEM